MFDDLFIKRGSGIGDTEESCHGRKRGTVGPENLKPYVGSCYVIVVRVTPEPENISINYGSLPSTYSFAVRVVELGVAKGTRVFLTCKGVPEDRLRRNTVRIPQRKRCILGERRTVAASKILKCIERNL